MYRFNKKLYIVILNGFFYIFLSIFSLQGKISYANNLQNNISTADQALVNFIGVSSEQVGLDNCSLFYSICMNKGCLQDEEKGACSCSPTISNIDKGLNFVDLNGDMVKQGAELYSYTSGICDTLLDKCKGQKQAFKNDFNVRAESQCVKYIAENPELEPSISKSIEDLKECMKPVCAGDSDKYPPEIEYVKCFDYDEAETLLTRCSNIIESSFSPNGLKEYFKSFTASKMDQYCDMMSGTPDKDRLGCFLEVGYGTSKQKILTTKKYKMGDIILCSSEYFGTETQELRSYAKENLQKIKTREKKMNRIDNINSAVQTVATIAQVIFPGTGSNPISGTLDTIIISTIDNAPAMAAGEMDIKEGLKNMAVTIGTAVITDQATKGLGNAIENSGLDIKNVKKITKISTIASSTSNIGAVIADSTGNPDLAKGLRYTSQATGVSASSFGQAQQSFESAKIKAEFEANVASIKADQSAKKSTAKKTSKGVGSDGKMQTIETTSVGSSSPELADTSRQLQGMEKTPKKSFKNRRNEVVRKVENDSFLKQGMDAAANNMIYQGEKIQRDAYLKEAKSQTRKGFCFANGKVIGQEGDIIELYWKDF